MSFRPALAAPPMMRAVTLLGGLAQLSSSDDIDATALTLAYALGACCPECPLPLSRDSRAYAIAVGEWFAGKGGRPLDLTIVGGKAIALLNETSGVAEGGVDALVEGK